MTALADALARAQAPGAPPKYRLKQNGFLTVKKAEKVSANEKFIAQMLARAQLHDQELAQIHNVDLGFHERPFLRQKGAPRQKQLDKTICQQPRPNRIVPTAGDRTQAFAKTHSCDKTSYQRVSAVPTPNYMPERPRVSKALLVRRMIRCTKQS